MTPINLKRVMEQHGIKAAALAAAVRNIDGQHISRSAVYQCCNQAVFPLSRCPDFTVQAEEFLRCCGVNDNDIRHIWESEQKKAPANGEGNTITDNNDLKEAAMLTPAALKQYKLLRNPFMDEVRERADVFMGESHRMVESCMMDAAHNGGFMALCGECGSGKSVLRRKLVDQLQHDNQVRIIYPQTPDKSKLTSAMILEAIVGDLAEGTALKRSHEARARQVAGILIESAQAGMRHVLIIEEAHDLSVPTMKQLKRLWEIEDGFRKVLGIIMIGQTELRARLNRQTHPEMREVILRCLISELYPLDRDLEAYVAHKFQRAGVDYRTVFDSGWVGATRKRLVMHGRSTMYPLYINNLLAAAMNLSASIGEKRVNADLIEMA